MLKRDVRDMVSYLVGEKKSFKVTFANGKVEVVEYRGYCWVLGNKGYSDEDLVKKMVKFQVNVSKFIIRLEVIEEVEEVEEVEELEETSIEVSLVEEVENLTDDLFQEEDLAYCEEAIKRESNIDSLETNKRGDFMTNKEKKYLDYIDERVYHCLQQGIDKKQIAEWLDDVIYDLSDDNSSELFNTLYRIQDNLLLGNEII